MVAIRSRGVLIDRAKARGSRKSGWRPADRGETVAVAVGRTVHATHGTHAGLITMMLRTNSKRVLREAQTDAALGAVVKRIAVKLLERLGRERRVLELNKTHGPIVLGAETKSLVAALL